MPRTTRSAPLLVALAAMVLAAACTVTVPGSAAPAGSGSASLAPTTAPAAADPATWVNDVCGAMLPFAQSLSSRPEIDTSDPASAVLGVSEFLGRVVAALDSTVAGLPAAGPSPVEGGDEIVSRLTELFTTFRTSFQQAKDTIDAVDTTNLQEVLAVLPAAFVPLEELVSLPDPSIDLKANPELAVAYQQAPNCQSLESS